MSNKQNTLFGNMDIKTGCDIVEIDRFRKTDKSSLLKIFYESEIRNSRPETLAGLFAAKESCKKAFNSLRWHDIIINKEKSGKPLLSINKKQLGKNAVLSSDLSISHDGSYAIAIVVFVVKKG
ncbi:holo-ACP synthase [Candidatus Woesearchaeota archaeon]|nr:holo-ACP synthase [Candidatus Woesearchaeota archaeon]